MHFNKMFKKNILWVVLVSLLSVNAFSYVNNDNLFDLFYYEYSPFERNYYVNNILRTQRINDDELYNWTNSYIYKGTHNQYPNEEAWGNPLYSSMFYNKYNTFSFLLYNVPKLSYITLAFLLTKAYYLEINGYIDYRYIDLLCSYVAENYGSLNQFLFYTQTLNVADYERNLILSGIKYRTYLNQVVR